MILILLLLVFPTVVESCLVVKTVEPPKCECQSLALSISNIESIIGNHEFYKSNISKYSIHAPKISTDDCNTQMYCEGDYSLVVFDGTEKYHVFGAYSADGLCDPFTQKWLVDDGSPTLTTYGKMQGVCVDYTTKTNTCPCRLYTVDTQNAREMIGPYKMYLDNWHKYQMIRPTLTECNSTFSPLSCPQNMTNILLTALGGFENTEFQLTCGTDAFDTPQWSVRDIKGGGIFIFKYIYLSCVDYNTPIVPPPTTPKCHCDYKFLTEQEPVPYNVKNYLMSMVIDDDLCAWSFGCKEEFAFSYVDGEFRRSDRFDAVCHEDINKWTVRQHKSTYGEEQIFENQDVFTYACASNDLIFEYGK